MRDRIESIVLEWVLLIVAREGIGLISRAVTIPIMWSEGFWINVQGHHPRLGAGTPHETTVGSCVDCSLQHAGGSVLGEAHQGGHQDLAGGTAPPSVAYREGK